MKETTALTSIFILSLAFKILLIPSYISTDFDVHRNWLSIVYNLPLSKWYYEDTCEWTLDYPPFFAYFEYILSIFAHYADPNMLNIQATPYRSISTILFQRFTVIVTDLVLAYATYAYISMKKRTQPKEYSPLSGLSIFALLILNAGLFYVDHIHFQYNGILMGLLILSISYVEEGHHLMGAFYFAVALNFKHLFLYAAPVYFIYLLSKYCFEMNPASQRSHFSIAHFVQLGVVVGGVTAISLGPFLLKGQLFQLLSRLFPFGRGLCHAYWAPNFWAVYNAADRVLLHVGRKYLQWNIKTELLASSTAGLVGEIDHAVLPAITPKISLALIVTSIAPMLWQLWKKPSPISFKLSVVLCSLSFYMFGWHVHEKAILMATVPLCLMITDGHDWARMCFFLSTVGYYSLFPLLFLPTETPIKIEILMIYISIMWVALKELYKPSFLLRWYETFYLLGLAIVQLFYSWIQPLYFPHMPFIGLMITSLYCSFGIIYSYLFLYAKLINIK